MKKAIAILLAAVLLLALPMSAMAAASYDILKIVFEGNIFEQLPALGNAAEAGKTTDYAAGTTLVGFDMVDDTILLTGQDVGGDQMACRWDGLESNVVLAYATVFCMSYEKLVELIGGELQLEIRLVAGEDPFVVDSKADADLFVDAVTQSLDS